MDQKIKIRNSVADLFDQFIDASTMMEVLSLHHRIMNLADLSPGNFNEFYPNLKKAVYGDREMTKNWRSQALFSKIDKKSSHKCYLNTRCNITRPEKPAHRSANSHSSGHESDISSQDVNNLYKHNNALDHYSCLVIGAGPAGLRTSIELQFLGASKVVIAEKRNRFSRNNVVHLWPFVIDDLKSLGAKELYGKFCAGSIDHISIRQLQLILLKICLLIGCDFRESCSYVRICPESLSIKSSKEVDHEYCDRIPLCEQQTNKNIAEENIEVSNNTMLLDDDNSDNEIKSLNKNIVTIASKHVRTVASPELFLSENDQTSENLVNQCISDSELSDTSHKSKERLKESLDIKIEPKKPTPKPTVTFIHPKADYKALNLNGVRAHFTSEFPSVEDDLHSCQWDIIIGADGHRNTLGEFFPRTEFRGRLAIAITANFVNRQTPKEAAIPEISGISYIYKQDMFNALAMDTDIMLENICYYKDDTHYFVMTAKKNSLLCRNVLKADHQSTQELLSDSNIDRKALLEYARDAATWSSGLDSLEFALNHYGREDCAMFDFTSMYAASNASKALRSRRGGLTLMALVGDSLLEPFWPTGSGCGRGFLSSLDAAWMCRQWAVSRCAVVDRFNLHRKKGIKKGSLTHDFMALNVIAERESIYRMLAQTTSENLQQNYSQYSLVPHSRYSNLNKNLVAPTQIQHLLTDGQDKCETVHTNNEVNEQTKLANKRKNYRTTRQTNDKRFKETLSSSLSNVSYRNASDSLNYRWTSMNSIRRGSESSEPLSSSSDDVDSSWTYEDLYKDLGIGRAKSIDDFISAISLSGTNPSYNNLVCLEAKRDKEIEECLRHQRNKAQLSMISQQLARKLRVSNSVDLRTNVESSQVASIKTSDLYRELQRVQKRTWTVDQNFRNYDIAPLKVYNSIRRCTSFAERVKSFETRLGKTSATNESAPTTPRIIENVRNSAQYEKLQKLFSSRNQHSIDEDSAKTSQSPKKIVLKLSKDDWNVKCWEDRLANRGNACRTSDKSNNIRALNQQRYQDRAQSVDLESMVSERKNGVFKHRIAELAKKLEPTSEFSHDDPDNNLSNSEFPLSLSERRRKYPTRCWIDHLKQELTNHCSQSESSKYRSTYRRPIGRLFADDEDE